MTDAALRKSYTRICVSNRQNDFRGTFLGAFRGGVMRVKLKRKVKYIFAKLSHFSIIEEEHYEFELLRMQRALERSLYE